MPKKLVLLIPLVIVLLGAFFLSYKAKAAEGLTISPPINELNLERGKTYTQTIKINNPTKELVEMYPVAKNFTSSDNEDGVPKIEDPNSDATYGLATWISFTVPKIALLPEQDIEFTYKITVPKDAEPGGHYGVVLFASKPPAASDTATQVTLSSMVGSLVLGNVAGEIVQKADIREFKTSRKIYFKMPTKFILKIGNTGNTHVKPIGNIVVKSMFGRKVGDLKINETKGNVLPNSTRQFDSLWNFSQWAFGRYTGQALVAYGSTNATLSAKTAFYVIPLWLLILLGLIILLVIFWLVRRKKRKAKNKSHELPPKKFVMQ